ncbi:DUF397 domain-containing protein [Haloechinothrix sp. LS1_15]|uniref:DUF397 domain-containing protein n=1 Tax=Haloechinothrix sp. LS1_15 TaxID=2652248 RepID=UPI0029455F1A|nr:DUF397 domain-containing protein [Haloechinothrix sp. LS1_15]MDV6011321.1 DUF397 domain-containing protein [Haloechinothrix sp. LS1_15]
MSTAEIDWTTSRFVKSSYSSNNGGECVEVGRAHDRVGVRDSKRGQAGEVLTFSTITFTAFLRGVGR